MKVLIVTPGDVVLDKMLRAIKYDSVSSNIEVYKCNMDLTLGNLSSYEERVIWQISFGMYGRVYFITPVHWNGDFYGKGMCSRVYKSGVTDATLCVVEEYEKCNFGYLRIWTVPKGKERYYITKQVDRMYNPIAEHNPVRLV